MTLYCHCQGYWNKYHAIQLFLAESNIHWLDISHKCLNELGSTGSFWYIAKLFTYLSVHYNILLFGILTTHNKGEQMTSCRSRMSSRALYLINASKLHQIILKLTFSLFLMYSKQFKLQCSLFSDNKLRTCLGLWYLLIKCIKRIS